MSTGHGNHWECLGKPVDGLLKDFIPLVIAKGKVGSMVNRNHTWFGSKKKRNESLTALLYQPKPLGCMVILASDYKEERQVLYTGYPCSKAGSQHTLKIVEIHDWGNQAEAVLVCETLDGLSVSFFDTQYFANQDRYTVGECYEFTLAGLIYSCRCTNDETIVIDEESRIREMADSMGQPPETRSDGTLEPITIDVAGCIGLTPASDEDPDDAEFYCVIGRVKAFELNGISFFQITPKASKERSIMPGAIFGAASAFKDGYQPQVGDSIGGGLWLQGFLNEPE